MNRTCSIKNLAVGLGLLALAPVLFASLLFAVVGVVLANDELFRLLGGKFHAATPPGWVLVVSGLSVAGWGALLVYKALPDMLRLLATMVALCVCVRYVDWLTHTLVAYHQSPSLLGILFVWNVPLWFHLALLPIQLVEVVLGLLLVVGFVWGGWRVLRGLCRLGAEVRESFIGSPSAE